VRTVSGCVQSRKKARAAAELAKITQACEAASNHSVQGFLTQPPPGAPISVFELDQLIVTGVDRTGCAVKSSKVCTPSKIGLEMALWFLTVCFGSVFVSVPQRFEPSSCKW
jgi:hypothetical protein